MNPVVQKSELQLRQDLQWCAHADQHWVVRDPLTSNFFRLNQCEKTAAALMNGRNTPAQILAGTRQEFRGLALDPTWLRALIARLKQHHLLRASSDADTRRLAALRTAAKQQGVFQKLISPLAIRIPLFDPSPLLQSLQGLSRVLFHPWMIAFWLVAGPVLTLLVMQELLSSHFSLASELNAMHGDRWFLLMLAYLVAKSLHELGHALACVRLETRCNEIGLMLLCLAPCLYCDTTDSWKLPSKWQRASIAAAGMYVELILATVASLVWLVTMEGTLHFLAASMMVVCSVGTVFVNANPLLKYDGYYILSDLWNVPNLADQSRGAWQGVLRFALTGRRPNRSAFDASWIPLALYGVASGLYRLFVLGLILWISWTVLVPLGLGFVAIAVTGSVVLGMALTQIRSLRNFYRESISGGDVRFFRTVFVFTVIFILLALVFELPIPSYVRARAVSDFKHKIPLFVSQTAEVVSIARSGTLIPAGDEVFQLESIQSQVDLVAISGRVWELTEKLRQLRQSQASQSEASYQVPVIAQQLAELVQRQQVLEREIEALRYVAEDEGTFLQAKASLKPAITSPRVEDFSSGYADEANIGCLCERSTLLGWFVKDSDIQITAIVGERDVRQLEVGMPVDVQWDSDLATVASGTVSRISPDALAVSPDELVGDPMLLSTRNSQGVFAPDSPHFEVTVDITQQRAILRGAPATIQIRIASKSLFERIVQFGRDNLRPIY